jgi:RNA polymerase sigma-70 factor (ECF subfamily)
MEDADVDRVVAMLVEDAAWAMPPLATWYRGLTAIRRFLEEYPLTLRWQHRPTRVNGQPALLCYRWRQESGRFEAEALDVLTLDGDRISEVTAFLDPSVHAALGLPLMVDR